MHCIQLNIHVIDPKIRDILNLCFSYRFSQSKRVCIAIVFVSAKTYIYYINMIIVIDLTEFDN